ncbi:Uncharacterised protein [Legionella pneumophila]|nr:Uncharacterised protein [Legionella pneumophila]
MIKSCLKKLQGRCLGNIHFEVAKIKTKDQVIIRGINEPEVAEQISKLSKKM